MAAKTPAITLKPAVLKTLITDPTLCRLNLAILIQHAILTALFYIIPTTLADFIHQAHLGKTWHFYLPVMLLSFILMLPALRAAEKQQQIYTLLRTMILLLAASQLLLAWYITSWVPFCILMLLYFIAFNTLEAALPAQISREAPSHLKGTAMGIYSSAQFSGLFLGGALAGYIDTHYGHTGILTLNGLLACGWYILLRTHHSGSSR